MKKLRRILGLCLVLAASAGLVVACGPETSSECNFDSECAEGEACLQPPGDSNRCVTDCSSDATLCGENSVCSDRYGTGDTTQVCVPDDVLCVDDTECPGDITCDTTTGFCNVGTQGPECTENTDCAEGEVCENEMCVAQCTSNEDCAEGEVCNDDGVCEETSSTTYFFLEITDTTDLTSDACVNPDSGDPGSDFLSAEIIIDGQDPGIWARAVNWTPILTDESGNDNTKATLPDHLAQDGGGAPPYDIDNGTCPDPFSDDNLISLGCGGKIWIEFRDSSDARVEIPTDGTADIFVYEYGEGLCGSDPADKFSVELCEISESDIQAAGSPDDVDCTGPELISDGGGQAAATDITVE